MKGGGGGVGVYVAGEWVQVLMEKRWYLPRCCGCGPKEPVCSLVAEKFMIINNENKSQLLHKVGTSRHFHIQGVPIRAQDLIF